MSKLCPRPIWLNRNSTDFWQTLYLTGQTLYFSGLSTDIGQWFDRLWTEIGFGIQSLSNQPMIGSTPIFRLTRPFTASKWALALTGSFCKSSKIHLHKSVQHEKSDSIIVCDSTMVVGRAKYDLVQLFNFCRTKLQKLWAGASVLQYSPMFSKYSSDL